MNCHECGHDINDHSVGGCVHEVDPDSVNVRLDCECLITPFDIASAAVAQAFDEAMGVIEAGDDWNTVIRKIFRLANPDLSTGEK